MGMRNVVVTDPPRADIDAAETLAGYGVATVHEALGRVGYLGPEFRPAWPGARMGGTAVTVLCWPGDNLMIHVAVEQCRPGDVLVVATNSPSTDGLFGELFAGALQHRGVRGAVLASGVRDVADLREMHFPVWSRAISAQGSVKATAGAVNVLFFFKQKTAYEIGLGIPAEPLFRSNGCGRPGRAPERFLPLDITSLLLHVIFDARFLLRQ